MNAELGRNGTPVVDTSEAGNSLPGVGEKGARRPSSASRGDSSPRRTSAPGKRRRKGRVTQVFILILALVGLLVLLYPDMSDWVNDRYDQEDLKGWHDAVEQLDDPVKQAMLDQAAAYNETLTGGVASLDNDGSGPDACYTATLSGLPGDVMARITVPEADIDLPIFHGTSGKVLDRAAGHLEGTSLPVGGEGTHAAIGGHSGFVSKKLFTDLHELEVGDTFYITVVGEQLHYRIDQILSVYSEDTEALARVDGKDYVTLFTCTPVSINSHRLLVRGVRIPMEEAAKPEAGRTFLETAASQMEDAGLPIWAVQLAGGMGLAYVVSRPPRPKGAGAKQGCLPRLFPFLFWKRRTQEKKNEADDPLGSAETNEEEPI